MQGPSIPYLRTCELLFSALKMSLGDLMEAPREVRIHEMGAVATIAHTKKGSAGSSMAPSP